MRSLTRKPVFSTAMRRVADHPDAFVLTNRFVYGLRAVGGLAAGVSGIGVPRFVMLNAISSALWAALFVGFGYAFGLGAEAVVGAALVRHERLLGIVAIVLAGLAGGWAATRALSRRAGARLRNPAGSGSGEALPQDGAPDGGRYDRGDQHRQ